MGIKFSTMIAVQSNTVFVARIRVVKCGLVTVHAYDLVYNNRAIYNNLMEKFTVLSYISQLYV